LKFLSSNTLNSPAQGQGVKYAVNSSRSIFCLMYKRFANCQSRTNTGSNPLKPSELLLCHGAICATVCGTPKFPVWSQLGIRVTMNLKHAGGLSASRNQSSCRYADGFRQEVQPILRATAN
jgi:hypothetical protein